MFFDANTQGTNRGLDAPTQVQVHDGASLSDVFLRTITNMGPHDTLAFNYSNQFNTYQIPINPTLTPVDSIVNVPGQDDVQLEYTQFRQRELHPHLARRRVRASHPVVSFEPRRVRGRPRRRHAGARLQ